MVPGEALKPGSMAQGHFLLFEETREAYIARVRADIQQNIKDIEYYTNNRPSLLFWPWGDYSPESVEIAQELGFKYSFSVQKNGIHPGETAFVLPRIGVSEKWAKFVRNATVFRHASITDLRRMISPSPSGLHRINWDAGS